MHNGTKAKFGIAILGFSNPGGREGNFFFKFEVCYSKIWWKKLKTQTEEMYISFPGSNPIWKRKVFTNELSFNYFMTKTRIMKCSLFLLINVFQFGVFHWEQGILSVEHSWICVFLWICIILHKHCNFVGLTFFFTD